MRIFPRIRMKLTERSEIFMDDVFNHDEKLYRAIYPPEIMDMFWRKDGTVSSAAFADANGLSVDRGFYRPDSEVVHLMKQRFTGSIIKLYVKNCIDIGAVVRYAPSPNNKYHSEIHGSETNMLLSKQQRHYLSIKAKILG